MTKKILYRVLFDENEEVARIFFEVTETGEQIEGSHQIQKWVNSLFEENKELRFKNRGLQSELQIFKEDVTHSNLQINKLADENKQLKHNNKMLSMKMSEVYTKYRLLNEFSKDTNPNDAVKRVLSELMQITKEYR